MKTFRIPLAAAVMAALCLFGQARLVAAGPIDPPISLAGDWRFAMDPDDAGFNAKWFTQDLSGHIKLPGILQAQGYGDDIMAPTPAIPATADAPEIPAKAGTPWVISPNMGPAWWLRQPAELTDLFSQPGHVEVPFLAQPPKHYLGVAWYQRDITIPDDWAGRREVLTLERAHWQTTVWVDDHQYAADDSLVASHITDLGVLSPGKHRLSIRVDNRTMLPAVGHLVDGHSVTDGVAATWNGLVGNISLTSTTPVWIDDAQVFPDLAKKLIHVKVKIGNLSGNAGSGNLSYHVTAGVAGQEAPEIIISGLGPQTAVTWDKTGGAAEFDVPVSGNIQTWSEFHPTLNHLFITLSGNGASGPIAMAPSGILPPVALTRNAVSDRREISFGMREISSNGRNLLLNGGSINLRLTHFGGDFPLTGYPAMDVATWKKIIQTCKDYGLNGMRFHSWCPPEAAFEAADEMGFYLDPECGMWNNFSDPAMVQRLNDEAARILKAYGNHPSFILLSASNEPSGSYPRPLSLWATNEAKADPRRLYAAWTGWSDLNQVNGPTYAAPVRNPEPGGGELRGTQAWFGGDYTAGVKDIPIPVLAHEVGQWDAYPDFDVIKKYTGYLRPGNYDIFRYIAAKQGLFDWDKLFSWASGRFQLLCYKEEFEANMRTPNLAGIQLLDLHDNTEQGSALIGVLDPFWQPKSYVTAAEFRQFAGPVVPLARLSMANRVTTNAASFEVDCELYNYGEKPLAGAAPYWKITSGDKTVLEGKWDQRDFPIGKNIPLGRVSADLSKFTAPGAFKLIVGLANSTIVNEWNFWVYPAQVDATVPADVLVTSSWTDAEARLATGGKVLFTPSAADLDLTKCPPMENVPVFWNLQMNPTDGSPGSKHSDFRAMLGLVVDPTHASLAEFPSDVNCDWQWTQIITNVHSINLDKAPKELRPIVSAIDDWTRDWRLGVLFECNVGAGHLMVSAISMDNPISIVGQQLRRSLLDYMGSDKFKPAVTLTLNQIRQVWASTAALPPVAEPTPPVAAPAPVIPAGQPGLDVDEGPAAPVDVIPASVTPVTPDVIPAPAPTPATTGFVRPGRITGPAAPSPAPTPATTARATGPAAPAPARTTLPAAATGTAPVRPARNIVGPAAAPAAASVPPGS